MAIAEGNRVEASGGASAEPILEIRGLVKRYGNVEALRGLDLCVRRGEVYGFLGRNGAGKSTTIRIAMGITRSSAGALELFGRPVGRIEQRQRIGYVAQEQNFYGWMTPRSLGRFVRGFYPTWDEAHYDTLVRNLDLPAGRKIRTFSGGIKVKLALAAALAHHPELLVLDEPTAGLDPVARREFLEMVRDQAERAGRTTFFSTHLIDEIELAAHRVGIVDGGRTLFEGTVAELSERLRCFRAPDLPAGFEPPLPLPATDPAGGWHVLRDRAHAGARRVIFQVDDPSRSAELLRELSAAGWWLEELPLEELFIEMVRKPAEVS